MHAAVEVLIDVHYLVRNFHHKTKNFLDQEGFLSSMMDLPEIRKLIIKVRFFKEN